MANNLVTKDYLDKRLGILKKEVTSDLIDFIDNSVVPLLKSMDEKLDKLSKNFENIKNVIETHERRLDKHDDKFLALRK